MRLGSDLVQVLALNFVRAPAGVLFFGVLLAAQATAGQDEVAPGGTGGASLQLFCLDTSGDAVALDEPVAALARQDSGGRLGSSVRGQELSHCWSWNETCAPRRLVPGEAWVCERTPAADSQLEVHISVRQDADHSRGHERFQLTAPPQVTAAPVEMWQEVPRSLLPTTTAAAGTLSLPRSHGPWRVQVWTEGRASAWQDVAAEENAVDLALLPAVEFSTQITADGALLNDARLFLVRPSWRGQRYPADLLGFEVAGSDGTVTLTLPKQTRWPIVVFSATRTAAAFASLEDVPSVVELGPGLRVTGQAVNEVGEPLVAVAVVGLSWIPDGFNLMQRHQGLSDFDGRFELTGFPLGPASLRATDGRLRFARSLELEGSIDLGPLVLTSPEIVWVQAVERGSRKPVPEARIQVGSSEWVPVDENGLARVSPLLGRDLLADAEGYLLARSELPEQVGLTAEEPFRVELEAAFTIKGTYVATDGTPAIGGRLAAIREATNRSIFNRIAPGGSFVVDLTAGSYQLELSAGNTGVRRLNVSGVPGEIRDLGNVVASPSAWVSGTLVSEADYTPVPEASVSYARPSEFGPLMAAALGNVDTVATNADGYFELYGLELGVSTLRVEAEGFARREFEVEADALGWVDAGMIELSRGRRITVRSDVGDGLVQLDPNGTGRAQDQIQSMLVEGEAVLEAVPDGPFRVRVYDEGALVCEKEGERSGGGVVTCDRMAMRVVGTVTVGGRLGDGMLLWKQKRANNMPEGVITTVGRGLRQTEIVSGQEQEMETMLDREGRYRLDAVLPGSWEVIWAPAAGGMQEVRDVRVPDGPGSEAVLDLHYEGVSIEGVVVLPDGQPVHLASIEVFPGRQVVVSDREGRFQVLGLQPSEYQLRARQMHLQSPLVDVELRYHGDRETVQLVLEDDPPNNRLTIHIQGGGSGLCFVEMESSVSQVAQIDGGRAAVAVSPPLADRVRIACQAEGRFILGDWQNLRQAMDRGVELDPYESTATISLVGEALGEAIQITGPGGWDLGSLRLWFGGASTFSVGESIANLPAGSYTLRWGDQTRTVWTERRRATEVEIDSGTW